MKHKTLSPDVTEESEIRKDAPGGQVEDGLLIHKQEADRAESTALCFIDIQFLQAVGGMVELHGPIGKTALIDGDAGG